MHVVRNGIWMNEELSIDYNFLKKTWNLKTELPVNSSIIYSTNIFDPLNKDLSDHSEHNRLIILIDKKVNKLYKKEMKNYFNSNMIEYKILEVDTGEENKNWKTVEKILHFFESVSVFRQEKIVIIGGGVLLDIGGFACSIYRRGIPYVKVPTTLLAIVDASVGAKVGINHLDRRNRLGSYFPAIETLVDKSFVHTQEEREIVNGLGEIFKIAIIKSSELFNLLDLSFESLVKEKFQYGAVPVKVINLSISLMLEELGPNLWEKNLKRAVDFGHTFSPVIELKNIPNLLHGEAVALDCIFSSCLSFNRGYIDKEVLLNIINVAKKLKLKTYHKDFTNFSLLKESMADAYKHRNGNQYLTLPIGIGIYKIFNDIEYTELKDAIKLFKEIN
jgi:2-epi-5-epi-valiolone synthase